MEEKHDGIRISTDAMIALVVTEAEERELANMPSLEEMNEAFHPSEEFQQKMDKLLRTAKNKERARRWRHVLKRVAVFITAFVTLAACLMMPAKAVREAVVTTLLEWKDQFMSIIISSEGAGRHTLPDTIELGYVPDGFVMQEDFVQSDAFFSAKYQNGSDFFTIQIISIEGRQEVAVDNERTTFYPIQFDSHDAIWGISEDGISTLSYNKSGAAFHISGTPNLNVLIKIAENIKM